MSCLVLFMHMMPCALVFALASAGRSMLARMAIIAMTTSNSMRVKPLRRRQTFECKEVVCIVLGFCSFLYHRKLSWIPQARGSRASGAFGRTGDRAFSELKCWAQTFDKQRRYCMAL